MTKKAATSVETPVGRKPDFIAYDIDRLSEDRAFWTRLGVAWICKDGSINVKLKAHNLTGEYNLQPRQDDDKG